MDRVLEDMRDTVSLLKEEKYVLYKTLAEMTKNFGMLLLMVEDSEVKKLGFDCYLATQKMLREMK